MRKFRLLCVLVIFLLFANIGLAEIDCSKETQANDSIQVGETMDLYALCKDVVVLERAFFYTNESGSFEKMDEQTLDKKESWVIFKYTGTAENVGKTISWFIEGENTNGNISITKKMNLKVVDITKPKALKQVQSKNKTSLGENINLGVLWEDNGGIKEVELSIIKGEKEEKIKKGTGIEFETEKFLDLNVSGSNPLTTSDISDKNFEAQSFIPGKKLLAGIELDFYRYIEPEGDITVEIRYDSDGEPHMKINPLTETEFSAKNITKSGFYFVDLPDTDLVPGKKYHIVVKGSKNTNLELRLNKPQIYDNGENHASKDEGKTWINTGSDLMFKTYYGIIKPVKFPTEIWTNFTWNETEIREDTEIKWKIYATDIGNNIGESRLMEFIVETPDCPEYCTEKLKVGECGDFGECEEINGEYWKSQICYKCDPDTKWKCVPYANQETCEIKVTKGEALDVLREAEEKMMEGRLREPKIDLASAENLMREAQNAYGNWEKVKEKASKVIEAIETASLYKPTECPEFEDEEGCIEGKCFWYSSSCHEEPKSIGGWIIVLVIFVIMIGAGSFLIRIGKFRLPLKTNRIEKEESGNGREERGTCSICGASNRKMFTCKDCKTRACYRCVKKYRGKTYCKACLRKRGLL